MPFSLSSHAAAAKESTHALERALASSRSQWGDATRQTFDQHYAEVAAAAGRKTAGELADLAEQLAAALASLERS